MYSLILNQTEIGADIGILESGGGGAYPVPYSPKTRPPEALGLYILSAMKPYSLFSLLNWYNYVSYLACFFSDIIFQYMVEMLYRMFQL